ncbi:GDSL-type esterase/lipase family protein [Amphibacillus sediminis]|uniref:GDSL-type esterase/lipase family protein n=1 Tax=Amphibacillus sediminis TaxID=360185 RepID=UPI00082D9C57|nr:GDSL-type esterase/lipase family protein [Amphibacillus sediminis]
MTRGRKRKIIIILTTFVIAGTLLFLTFRPVPINQTTVVEPNENNLEAVIEQVEDMDQEVQSTTNDISLNLKDAVEQTLSIFTRTDYAITAVGDSLTQGVGDETNNDGYLGVLNRRLNALGYRVKIDNFGKRGNRTDQLLTRLEEDHALQRSIAKADLVLITIGANDIMRIARENILDLNEAAFTEELDDYRTRLEEIYDSIFSYNPDAEIYLIGFYNPFEGIFEEIQALDTILVSWNEVSQSVSENYPNGHFIAIDDLFRIDQVNLLADDNFHPNTTGYALIGLRVLNDITPMLEQIATERELQDGNISME